MKDFIYSYENSSCHKNLNHNAIIREIGSNLYLVARTDIMPKEEIFLSYGWEYYNKKFLKNHLNTPQIFYIFNNIPITLYFVY